MKRAHDSVRLTAAVVAVGLVVWPARGVDARAGGAAFVRACSTQPSGVAVPQGFRTSSATEGPLSLYSFGALTRNGRSSSVPASRFAPVRAGLYRLFKLWAILPPGRNVRVTVPSTERGVLSLAYDPTLWNRGSWDGTARVNQGDPSVLFAACPRKDAQGQPPHVVYDGGLLAAGPRCARLNVRADGWIRARTLLVALGRRRC